jgi:hypothetical protein
MKRTTIFLPDDVHADLREEAFRARISMAEVIRLRIQTPAASDAGKPARKRTADPLLKAAGICRGTVLSEDIDQALYGEGD